MALMKVDEVAEMLAVSVRTVHTLREQGKLSIVKIGKSARFKRADVEQLIEDLTQN